MEQSDSTTQNPAMSTISFEDENAFQEQPWDGPDWPKCACIKPWPCDVKLAGPLRIVQDWQTLSASPAYPQDSDRFFDFRREAVLFTRNILSRFWRNWLNRITDEDEDEYDWFNQMDDMIDIALRKFYFYPSYFPNGNCTSWSS